MTLPKSLTTVTPFSKTLAAVLFITLPFAGFWLGMEYEYLYATPNNPSVLGVSGFCISIYSYLLLGVYLMKVLIGITLIILLIMYSVKRKRGAVSRRYLVGATVILGIEIIIWGLLLASYNYAEQQGRTCRSTGVYSSQPVPEEILINEGTSQVLIKDRQKLVFPSAAMVELTGNTLWFSYAENISPAERWAFKRGITVSANGYLHTFKDVVCNEESRFFGDYYANVVTQCTMQSTVARDTDRTMPSYDGVSVNFSSVVSDQVPRYRILNRLNESDPWIAVSIPYFQIFKRSDGSAVNVVSPKEDIVGIYTNYGHAAITIETKDILAKETKTVEHGPLVLHLQPVELTCAGIYREADGSCYQLDESGVTYNIVNFTLTIEQSDNSGRYPLLLDLKK